jgi:hypothetical protein
MKRHSNLHALLGEILLGACLSYAAMAARGESTNALATAPDLEAAILPLTQPGTTVEKVLQVLGQPERYSWEGRTLSVTNLPSAFLLNYPNGVSALVSGGKVIQWRSEQPGPGFGFAGKLRLGSSLAEVEEVVGPPSKTVVGQRLTFSPGVLYRDFDGNQGYSAYRPAAHAVQFFFQENKVISIYLNVETARTLLSPPGTLAIVRNPPAANFDKGPLSSLPVYDPNLARTGVAQLDLRGADLRQLDLSRRLSDLQHADFDDRTRWPDQRPPRFDLPKLMQLGKDPGLGVRQLHTKGITGKGIGIGIIDQSLLTGHVEYRDRLRLYEEIHNAEGPAQMHGPAVASIAVGRTVGVAPEADLYYIAANTEQAAWDFAWDAKAIDRLLAINDTLPAGRKIRVISISHGWTPQDLGYAEMTAAVERAAQAKVFVISSVLQLTHKLIFHGLGRDLLSDPNLAASYQPGTWWRADYLNSPKRFGPGRVLLVPMDARCLASPTGDKEYAFYSDGGWSWCVPWLAGCYALACQVDPSITPDRFWASALKTGATVTLHQGDSEISFGAIAQPVALIASLSSDQP